jgi:hypothetical protein
MPEADIEIPSFCSVSGTSMAIRYYNFIVEPYSGPLHPFLLQASVLARQPRGHTWITRRLFSDVTLTLWPNFVARSRAHYTNATRLVRFSSRLANSTTRPVQPIVRSAILTRPYRALMLP